MRKKKIALLMILVLGILSLAACDEVVASGTVADTQNTMNIANKLQSNQPTPNDIDYSLERYNLIPSYILGEWTARKGKFATM